MMKLLNEQVKCPQIQSPAATHLDDLCNLVHTVKAEIFAVVLFSRISRIKKYRENNNPRKCCLQQDP